MFFGIFYHVLSSMQELYREYPEMRAGFLNYDDDEAQAVVVAPSKMRLLAMFLNCGHFLFRNRGI